MPGGFGGFGGMPGGGGRSFHFSTNGAGGGPNGGFSFGDPSNIFSEFLRSQGSGMGGGDDDDLFASMGGMGGGGGRGRSSRFSDGPQARHHTPEVTTVEKPLAIDLEDLFRGTTKKMKIKRKTFDEATGKRTTSDKVLTIPIKAGLKKGSKIRFKGVGDQEEGGQQDLCFIVEEVSSNSIQVSPEMLIPE